MLTSWPAKFLLLIYLFTSTSLSAEKSIDTQPGVITVMSLNIYGWKTMPEHSHVYAELIQRNNVDILAIQEGVEDWQLKSSELDGKLPTNYQRAITLKKSLGQCWQHKFQIFINYCQGSRFIESGRFNLSDGPNATRTGEYAVIEKSNERYFIINIHWDHESDVIKVANAKETIEQLDKFAQYSKILLGDFNSQCDSKEVTVLQKIAKMNLLKHAGIDCLFVKDLTGKAKTILALPSDHLAIVAVLKKNSKNTEFQ